jgi:uncharacterized membrane protein YedE/YeeE
MRRNRPSFMDHLLATAILLGYAVAVLVAIALVIALLFVLGEVVLLSFPFGGTAVPTGDWLFLIARTITAGAIFGLPITISVLAIFYALVSGYVHILKTIRQAG